MAKNLEFPKAKLLQIRKTTIPTRFMYFRIANASELWFWWFHITWRRSWLPQAAYMEGWNACFRQEHGMPQDENQIKASELQDTFGLTLDDAVTEQDTTVRYGTPEQCKDCKQSTYLVVKSGRWGYMLCPVCGGSPDDDVQY